MRQLKSNKADKADIDKEIAKLLEMKLKLSQATGTESPKKSKAKNKKK